MNRTRRGRSHGATFRAVMRWPNMIPDSDVELPARLADWGVLYGVHHICIEAALEYRQHCAPNLDVDQLKALAMLAHQMYEDGKGLGQVCQQCGQDIEPEGGER